MRSFKLHTKAALLSSMVIVAMLVAALVITSAAIANIERNDDRTLAEIQARDLAQHITDMRSPDPATLTRAALFPSLSRFRKWWRSRVVPLNTNGIVAVPVAGQSNSLHVMNKED